MAKHNVLFETDNFIPHCMNRAGVADFDIDGGSPVVEGAVDSKNKELYALAKPTATTARVAIAYNPSVKYDVINGKAFPAHSTDDRDYTNPAGKAVDYFFPEVGVEFGILAAGVDGSTAPWLVIFLSLPPLLSLQLKRHRPILWLLLRWLILRMPSTLLATLVMTLKKCTLLRPLSMVNCR